MESSKVFTKQSSTDFEQKLSGTLVNILNEKLTIDSLNRVIYVEKCNIESFFRYFKKLSQTHQVFIFPYHLKESK